MILNASKSFDEAEKVKESLLCTEGQKHYLYKADVGDPEEVNLMMKKIHNQIGKLDILVNNAGITKFIKHSDLHELSSDIFDKIYAVNLRGAFLCIQKALPLLRNASSLNLVARVLKSNLTSTKISSSGKKVTIVPVFSSLPITLIPFKALPLEYFCVNTLPSLLTKMCNSLDNALTTDKPTPCRPPETL